MSQEIARMLRVCASRIDAGEPWRETLADYGLVLTPADAPGGEWNAAMEALRGLIVAQARDGMPCWCQNGKNDIVVHSSACATARGVYLTAPTDQAGVREALEACRLAFDSIEDIQRQGYTVDEAIGEQARRRTVALNLMSAALTQPPRPPAVETLRHCPEHSRYDGHCEACVWHDRKVADVLAAIQPRPPGADWADELAEWASHLTCQHSDLICACIKERLAVMLTRPQASEPAHCDACLIANGHSAELETHCDGVPPRPPEDAKCPPHAYPWPGRDGTKCRDCDHRRGQPPAPPAAPAVGDAGDQGAT